ncbi:hypothetical protein [Micromonospora sp. WMMD1082]|nr:hypothetical protein [Micromonospora sp. WMMD1082]MDG4795599.1 hypothetical protein [Micromonospora sp. WMMD1082]
MRSLRLASVYGQHQPRDWGGCVEPPAESEVRDGEQDGTEQRPN